MLLQVCMAVNLKTRISSEKHIDKDRYPSILECKGRKISNKVFTHRLEVGIVYRQGKGIFNLSHYTVGAHQVELNFH